MDNSTGEKISLRKATTDEVAYLKAKAAKQDNEQSKKVLPIMVLALLADLGLAIYNQDKRIIFICIFALGFIGICLYLFVFSKYFTRQFSKREFSVQRGKIVDKRKSEYSDSEIYPKVVFESDDGTRSVIAVEKDNYTDLSEGPCIVIKWDSYGDSDVYEVVMLDQKE